MKPSKKIAPGAETGGIREIQSTAKNTPHQPEPSTSFPCFGKAHEPHERGNCATCYKVEACAAITPLWTYCDDRRRARSVRNLVDGVHRKFGYPRRMLAPEYQEVFNVE